MHKLLLTILLIVLLAPSGYCKPEKGTSPRHVKHRLTQIKKRIQEKKEEIKISRKKAVALLDEIDALDRKNAGLETTINGLNVQKQNLLKALGTTQKSIDSLTASITAQQALIDKRMVANFKLHQTGYLQIMLAADSPVDMEKRYTFMGYIIQHDEQQEAGYLAKKNALVQEHRSYAQQKSNLDAVMVSMNKQQTDLMKARSQKTQVLASIRDSTQATRRVLVELENSEEKLQHALKSFERTPVIKTGFAAMKGKLPFPVQGTMDDIFGRTTNSIIDSKGVLFRVNPDAQVKAVYTGVVVWSEWLKGYGNTIILDHGNHYFTIYAHIGTTDSTVGENVQAGQMIGSVGDAGIGKDITLYFELRHGETPLNPGEWFRR